MKKKVLSMLLLSILVIMLTGCGKGNTVILKDDLNIEINSEVKVLSLISEKNELEVINKDDIIDTKNLGEKKIIIKYLINNEEKEFTANIKIVDTTKPIIEYKKELITTLGTEIDLLKDVKVSDNSKEEIKATINGKYDINKVGTYNLKYIAVDSSDNKVEEEFILIVKKIPTLTLGKKYYDKNNMYKGSSLRYISLNKDNSVISSSCGKNAGCTDYKGKFTISGTTLTISYTKYQDVTGLWANLPKSEQKKIKFTITDDNTFSDSSGIFVIK